jgi:hypothetical protein
MPVLDPFELLGSITQVFAIAAQCSTDFETFARHGAGEERRLYDPTGPRMAQRSSACVASTSLPMWFGARRRGGRQMVAYRAGYKPTFLGG